MAKTHGITPFTLLPAVGEQVVMLIGATAALIAMIPLSAITGIEHQSLVIGLAYALLLGWAACVFIDIRVAFSDWSLVVVSVSVYSFFYALLFSYPDTWGVGIAIGGGTGTLISLLFRAGKRLAGQLT